MKSNGLKLSLLRAVLVFVAATAWMAACAPDDDHPETVVAAKECATCHESEATAFAAQAISHTERFTCEKCHADDPSGTGPGHRATTPCIECHFQMGHPPLMGASDPGCALCHDPHGTSNLYGIRTKLRLSLDPADTIDFRSLNGKAAYSFAETAEAVGTGVCETCHYRTKYYDSEGRGSAHPTGSCIECHKHGKGFIP